MYVKLFEYLRALSTGYAWSLLANVLLFVTIEKPNGNLCAKDQVPL